MAFAVVTGASGALGRAVVDAFATRGDRVLAVARSAGALERLEADHPNASEAICDLTDADAVEELWTDIDRGDRIPTSLVNTIGGYRGGRVVDASPVDLGFMLDLNLATAWWSCRAAARRMQAAGAGSIVNVSARTALIGGSGSAAYAVAKAGVVKLTEVLADELKSGGVRVNAVLPALIDTPANRESYPPERITKAVEPQAIARVIAFLCSDDAAPITGAAIPVYGRF
jgi:NAD(P)-dependent dehydrogenase (short-subunit alcohol dehydrogenase family)